MIRTAAAVLILSLVVPVSAQEASSIPWHTVPTVASAVARAQQKMLLVYLRDDCRKCNDDADALMKKLATDDIFLRSLDAFLPLKITKGAVQHPIAEELGISVTAAMVRLHRGRKKMRDLLYEEAGRHADAV